MKTQILRLETHDDFISARDKMGWSQTGRILLVWPDQGRVLTRQLDLTLIQRHSTKLGAQLALVTHETEVIYQAGKLGIPVYKSIEQAQKAHWRVEQRRRRRIPLRQNSEHPRPDLEAIRQAAHPANPKYLTYPAVRLVVFTIGVLALLAIVAVLTPAAKIQIKPASIPQEASLTVKAGPEIDAINLSGAVPAHWVNVTVEGRDSIPTQGSSRIPQAYASGSVQFTNLTDQPVVVPQGLVVRSIDNSPIRFEVTRSGEIPAGVERTISLPVKALVPGKKGNLPAGALIGIEGLLGARITAFNPKPTTGGIDQLLSVPTDADRQELFNKLETSLRKTALDEFRIQLNPDDVLFTPTITISQVIDHSFDPDQDLPSDQLGLNLRIEYKALSASADELRQMGDAILDASLKDGYIPLPDTLQMNALSQPVVDDSQTAHWKIQFIRQIQARLATYDAASLVLGLPPTIAARRLEAALPMDGSPMIQINPSWWPRMPVLPFRIEVNDN